MISSVPVLPFSPTISDPELVQLELPLPPPTVTVPIPLSAMKASDDETLPPPVMLSVPVPRRRTVLGLVQVASPLPLPPPTVAVPWPVSAPM